MTREEVIEHLCQTVALVYHSIGDYSNPSDGFCHICEPFVQHSYQHSGETLEYVRNAVVEKLRADGVKLNPDIAKEMGITP